MWSPYLFKNPNFMLWFVDDDLQEMYFAALGCKAALQKLSLTQVRALEKLRELSFELYNMALVKILTMDGWVL
jgi:hypothetical protein